MGKKGIGRLVGEFWKGGKEALSKMRKADAEAAKKERKQTANQQWSAQKAWQDLFNLDFLNQVHQLNPSQAISLEMPALQNKDWMVLVVICVLAWKI